MTPPPNRNSRRERRERADRQSSAWNERAESIEVACNTVAGQRWQAMDSAQVYARQQRRNALRRCVAALQR
ncbi:hypothetical protein ACD584_15715, partial [Xanthomonas sp. NCPPB 2922]